MESSSARHQGHGRLSRGHEVGGVPDETRPHLNVAVGRRRREKFQQNPSTARSGPLRQR